MHSKKLWIRGRKTKTLLLMKLTFFFMTAALLHVYADGLSQTITFSGKNVPLQKVFSVIEQQTGYVVFYNKDLLQHANPVTCNVHNVPLTEFLSIALKDQSLTYEISGKTILIARKSPPVVTTSNATPPPVTGVVYSSDGKVLAGATIRVKGTITGTHTDAAGHFSIDAEAGQVIVISYVGYKDKEITLSASSKVIAILEISASPLDQVVYKGYYSTSRRLSTGSENTVTAQDIEKQPIANPLQALQGRVPGMLVTQTSGTASASFSVQIRGQNSISFASDPLFVIDGVPMMAGAGDLKNLGLNQNNLATGITQSPFFSMNPADIESISILKDADATAIYGSQGANGVVLITTKRGKPGKNKFDINVYSGAGKVTRLPKLLNTDEYLTLRNEAYKNDNITPTVTNAPDLKLWDQNRDNRWQDYLLGHTAQTYDAQVGFSGGDEYTQYRISGGYHRQTDITTETGADKRGSFSMSVNSLSRDRKFKIGLTGNYSNINSNMVSMNSSWLLLPPNAPAAFDSLGNVNFKEWGSYSTGIFTSSDPFSSLLRPYEAITDNLQGNLNLQYQPISKLTLKVNGGFNSLQNSQLYFTPKISIDPTSSNKNGTGFGNNSVKTWIVEPQAEFVIPISRGKLSVLAGSTFQNTITKTFNAQGTDYANEALMRTLTAAKSVSIYADNTVPYRYEAVFGRINYNWANKYLLNATARRDGSSRFGPGRQFGDFGAIGAGWIFTSESFMEHVPVLSYGKLRASYGITGSANIGDYSYLSRWSGNTFGYTGTATLSPIQHYDSNYGWEENKKLEVALEMALLKDRIQITTSWYRNRSDNQLVRMPLPTYTGFSYVTTNLPALVQNMGWEVLITSSNIRSKNLTWNTSFNITRAKNKLISFPGLASSPYNETFEVGKPLSIIRLVHFQGIDPQTGKYMFEDQNGDGKIVTTGVTNDLVGIFDKSPSFFGGMQNTVQYKNWQLSFMMQFVKQKGVYQISSVQPGGISNQSSMVLSRWQNAGDITNVAKATSIYTTDYITYMSKSDALVTDASYIRLQNLSISYTLPQKWASKYLSQYTRVYIQGQNLFTITSYKGSDPETGYQVSNQVLSTNLNIIPPVKFLTAGLQITF